MRKAIDAVKSNNASYREAATRYSVPHVALWRRVSKSSLTPTENHAQKNHGRFNNVLLDPQEQELKAESTD